MNYTVLENVLDFELSENIKNIMSSNDFPWYYLPNISGEDDNERFHFTHMLSYREEHSKWYEYMALPIIKKIPREGGVGINVHRVKVNLFVKEKENLPSKKHTDEAFPHKVALYYVNTNNGYTLLYGDKENIKIPSIQNNMLILDGSIPHSAVSQTDTKIRMGVNITYNIIHE